MYIPLPGCRGTQATLITPLCYVTMLLCYNINSRSRNKLVLMSQGLLGLCCSIETRDCIEISTITAVLFE